MKKICVVTSTRAEYGLLYWLIKAIKEDESLQLQLIVTGTHLEKEFGHTIDEITKEFNVDYKIPLNHNDDSKLGISNSMALAQIGFTKAYQELQPDLIVLLGDRYEIFCAASSALISQIPVGHIHGGELTQGAYDDAFRHSITKMSHLHFCATQEYKQRVIQLGENHSNVYYVGGMGVENIKRLELLNQSDLENAINFKLNKKNLLITYHPETLSNISSKEQFQELLDALDTLEDTNIIFTYANSDTDGKIINKMIEQYRDKHKNTIAFKSMGQLRYLSSLQYIDAVVGNTSSGILEAPSFKIGTINIGDRQKGRTQAKSILNCRANKNDILSSFTTLYSKKFQKSLAESINPYDSRSFPSNNILQIIKTTDFDKLLKKTFFDMKDNNE